MPAGARPGCHAPLAQDMYLGALMLLLAGFAQGRRQYELLISAHVRYGCIYSNSILAGHYGSQGFKF